MVLLGDRHCLKAVKLAAICRIVDDFAVSPDYNPRQTIPFACFLGHLDTFEFVVNHDVVVKRPQLVDIGEQKKPCFSHLSGKVTPIYQKDHFTPIGSPNDGYG